jgi:hypothetical protein
VRRRNALAAAAIALIVTAFGCGSRQPPGAEGPKTDRPLKPLPAEIEGVERVGDALRTKPGFEWVKQSDGTMIVQKPASAGGGVIILLRCACDTGQYPCVAQQIDATTYKCVYLRDCLSCKWFDATVDDLDSK